MNVIDEFFEKINNLPMLPKVVQEASALLNQDEVDTKALCTVIARDQVFAARVLRLSNSAYFGCSRTIKTIEDAIALIGFNSLKTLLIASGVTSTFTQVPGVDLKKFWQHSLVSATIARQLSRQLRLDAETAYIAGLMHSVGQLPIHLVFPAAGAQVAELSQGKGVLERKTVEQSMLGIDHCQIGEMIARLWNFPEEILCVIRHYAEPMHAEACNLAPIVYAAVHIGLALELGDEAIDIANRLDQEVRNALQLNDTESLAEDIESYRAYLDEAKSYL